MQRQRRLLALPLAVVLGAGLSPVAGAAASPVPPPAGDPARTVTLITGDRVTLAHGTPSIHPAAGRENIPMLTTTVDGHVRVVPADALAALRTDKLDARLFDVTGLLAAGYDDRRGDLPLMTTTPTEGTQVRRLPSINATAVRTSKRDLNRLWKKNRATGGKLWLDAVGHFTGTEGVQQIGAPQAWQAGLTGTGVTVGLIDSGVDVTHPDLAGAVTAQMDFSPLTGGGVPTAEDVHDVEGHGTAVASILAGRGVASGGRYRGVAPGASVVSAKVGDFDVSESSVIAAMEWTAGTQHAKVVNMSLGFPNSPGVDPLEAAVNDMTGRYGTLFVVAAGNDGRNGNDPNYGNDYDIASPGDAAAALTVGAVDHDDNLADFSSRGPGLEDNAIKPEITAPGADITHAWSTDAGGSADEPYTSGDGTSFSSPHVAGSAAVLAQKHPDWTPAMLKAGLMGTAVPKTGLSAYAQGAGRVDIPRALNGALLADPPSLSLGTHTWPHTGNTPITKTVTYRNLGPAPLPVTLKLSLPAELFALSATSLTVPAGGTAQVTVTAKPSATAADGPYTGQLTATTGGQVTTTPVALVREAATSDLTLHHLGRTGEPTADYYTEVIGIDVPYRHDTLSDYPWVPDVTLRVPHGRYAVITRFLEFEGDSYTSTMIAQPALTVDATTELTIDSRAGRPVTATVPEADAQPSWSSIDAGVRTPTGWTTQGVRANATAQLFSAQVGGDAPAADFVSVIRRTLVSGTGTYQLAWPVPGRVPTGFTGTVTAAELAVERGAVRRQAPGSGADMSASVEVPGYPLTLAALETEPAGTRRFSTGGGVRWTSQLVEYDEERGEYSVATTGPSTRYAPGQAYTSSWNLPVLAPCLDAGGISWGADQLRVRVAMSCDGDGHVGSIAPVGGTTTLFRAGAQIAVAETAGHATLPLSGANGDYRLSLAATRPAPFVTSTRTRVDWSFRDPAEVSKLDLVRMTPVGSTLRLTAAASTTSVRLEVSTDDGSTWTRVAVRKAGRGSYESTVTAAGLVSLRVSATNPASTVTETVIRAHQR